MARRLKPEQPWHAIRIAPDRTAFRKQSDEAVLVKGGKRGTYLAVHAKSGFASFTGEATLRALAKAILKEVGDG